MIRPLRSNAELMKEWRHVAGHGNTRSAGAVLGLSARTIEDIEQGRRRVGDALTRIALETLIAQAKKKALTP